MAITQTAERARMPLTHGGWLHSPGWDLTFISLSAILVGLPFGAYQLMIMLGIPATVSASILDVAVTLLIGGPHMYATFTRTVADPGFRANHRRIIATSVLIPIGVILLGLLAFPTLLLIFFFWASVHFLHQVIFLVECYNLRSPRQPSRIERTIDYVVIGSCLYPMAAYRLVNGTFNISDVALPFPVWLQHDWVIWLAFGIFGVALLLFLLKSLREIMSGQAHWPRLLLIGLTVSIGFFVPAASRLDAAFQGFNAWHSFQYLGLTWFANRIAAERHQPMSALTRRISGPHDGWRFYGLLVLCTIGAGAIIGVLLLLRGPLGLRPEQPFYMTILSFLLIHYYHDHVLFTNPEAIVAERVVAS
jgi:hypothetical protein